MSFNKVLEKALKEYFEVSEYNTEKAFNALSLFIYTLESKENDLFILARLLDSESLGKLISYYNGAEIHVPTKEEYRYSKIFAACFYLREVQKWNWPQIRDFLKLDDEDELKFDSSALGHKIKKLMEDSTPEFMSILMDSELYDMKSVMEKTVGHTGN
jgi:hypothetical protein